MVMPREAEFRCGWTSRYGAEWNMYLYQEGNDLEWSVRQDRQTAYFIGSATVQPKDGSRTGSAELVNIWVTPQYRRQRLGSVILADVLVWCREQGHTHVYGSILNESDADYKGLKRFYERAGFEVSFDEERSRRVGNNNATFEQILGDG